MGIDFAFKTIQNLKKDFPDIPVMAGDICHLNMKNESLDAYISLGVVEHFREGPVTPLKEASRVLKKGGTLIVSVPQAFQWRRLDAQVKTHLYLTKPSSISTPSQQMSSESF